MRYRFESNADLNSFCNYLIWDHLGSFTVDVSGDHPVVELLGPVDVLVIDTLIRQRQFKCKRMDNPNAKRTRFEFEQAYMRYLRKHGFDCTPYDLVVHFSVYCIHPEKYSYLEEFYGTK